MPSAERSAEKDTSDQPTVTDSATSLFDVRFEDTGFTSGDFGGMEFAAEEARGYTETSLSEGLLPKGVVAVVGGNLAEDDAQAPEHRKVFASVTLRVRAVDAQEATHFRPPVRLLNAIADLMASDETGTTQLALEGNWQNMDVDAAPGETEAEDAEPDTGTPMPHEIRIDGTLLIKGDATDVAIIFNNLSGVNFEGKEPASYAQYLARMASHFFGKPDAIRHGQRLELAHVGGKVILEMTVGGRFAPRLTLAELGAAGQPASLNYDLFALETEAESAPGPGEMTPRA